MRRLRIVVIAPFPPHVRARDGGSRSIANRLELTARRHDVSLLYLHRSGDPPLEPALAELCVEVVPVDRSETEGSRALGRGGVNLGLILWRAWRGTPVWAQAFRSSATEHAVEDLIARARPDVIQVEYQVMAQFLPARRPAPAVLVIHEPAVRVAENFAITRSRALRILNLVDRRAWARFEKRAVQDAERVVVFSPQDAEALDSGRPPTVVPMTLPVPPEPLDPEGADPSLLLFVGNYGHPPNVDAALWLVREIFPLVRDVHPSARLAIVGESPPPSLADGERDGVEVTGGVPDVEPWLDRAAVFVVPLRLGGGMRVKTLEALAAGKAIVSTSLGVAGLDLVGDELVIADGASEFAEQVNALLTSPARRRALAQRARRWAKQALSAEQELQAYESLYAELTAAKR
jgi:glycosyltransferase involved in cell wall biosynthesis